MNAMNLIDIDQLIERKKDRYMDPKEDIETLQ